MYHEERVIDGVLCWRGGPNEDWRPLSQKALSSRLAASESCVAELKGLLQESCGWCGWTGNVELQDKIESALRGEDGQ